MYLSSKLGVVCNLPVLKMNNLNFFRETTATLSILNHVRAEELKLSLRTEIQAHGLASVHVTLS